MYLRTNIYELEGISKLAKDHSFSEKLTFLTPWYACAYQEVSNVSFSENFAYVLNE